MVSEIVKMEKMNSVAQILHVQTTNFNAEMDTVFILLGVAVCYTFFFHLKNSEKKLKI